ncbi:hypothetical protein VTN00DRAFT_1396 [Thermoascus crustaceus]|uniref:uncharacterized protein n=1 Tax=Thermoascus crustaceus TaxID=5088 RepID=UPI003743C19E
MLARNKNTECKKTRRPAVRTTSGTPLWLGQILIIFKKRKGEKKHTLDRDYCLSGLSHYPPSNLRPFPNKRSINSEKKRNKL